MVGVRLAVKAHQSCGECAAVSQCQVQQCHLARGSAHSTQSVSCGVAGNSEKLGEKNEINVYIYITAL